MLERPISQYFRKVIATRIGLREFYDYKTHPMLEIAQCAIATHTGGLSTDSIRRAPGA